MKKQWLWLCYALTTLILLAGWSLYSIRQSDAQEEDYRVFLPLVISPPSPVLYGVAYIFESDLPELGALNVKLVTWQIDPSPQVALALLDMADGYGLRVILRLQGSHDWGWNGRRFDLSSLADFEPVIGGHPALVAVYGLHEPWERFTPDQLRRFYSQWQAVAPSLPVWHDMGHLPPAFTDDMCDVCGVSAAPHHWDQSGNPINLYEQDTRQRISQAQTYIQADPDAILCVYLQSYGRNFQGWADVRMPTADEMRENAAIVFGELQVTCGVWYPYRHGSYDYTLGDLQFSEQRQVVAETYDLYFAP
jgi:hypothetical protein